ncbi:hypothetical protein ACWEN6_36355 [Sphaerisporangium sp. NPDC004334]
MTVRRRMTALAVSAAAAAAGLVGTAGGAHAATATIHGEAKLCYTGFTCQTVQFEHELTPTRHAFRDSVTVDAGLRKITMRVASELGDNARPVFRISQITIQDFNGKTLKRQTYDTNKAAAAAPNLAVDKQTLDETSTINAVGTAFANFTS